MFALKPAALPDFQVKTGSNGPMEASNGLDCIVQAGVCCSFCNGRAPDVWRCLMVAVLDPAAVYAAQSAVCEATTLCFMGWRFCPNRPVSLIVRARTPCALCAGASPKWIL